jgi:opacity protein-like surface antigen
MWGLGLSAPPAGARDPAADDYSPYAPSGFFVFDWSGYYIGAHLGGATAEAESTEVLFPNSPEFFESATYGNSENSITGGVQGGWQRQFGKLVAGVGIDYALTPSLFLGVEYNFIHFRKDIEPPPIADTQFNDLDVDIQNVVVRLNYRFNPCCAWPGPGRP